MKFFRLKNILTLIIVLVASSVDAIENVSGVMPYDNFSDVINPQGHPNKEDANGRQGMWTIWGRMEPDKGYPADGKIEEGFYKNSRKEGEWIKYHTDGKTPRLKGMYVDNRPNGAYVKYHENGKPMEEGKFTDGKQVEVYKRWYDTGVLSQEKYFNAEGREEGKVRYYHPNGKLEFEYTKKDGVTVGEAKRYYPNGDVKEIIMYNSDGTVASRIEKEMVNPEVTVQTPVKSSTSAPDGTKGTTNGKKFKTNGYNKVYNSDQELWMDGEFREGKLLDGKLYKYDSDGILLKIEVWKDGKYHSDGQL
jgi:antitoxin component YwqK of YwqJK toxin-antitoxin module